MRSNYNFDFNLYLNAAPKWLLVNILLDIVKTLDCTTNILTTFGYEKKSKFKFYKLMTPARNRKYWSELVENNLNLPENSYSQKNSKHQADELQTCDTI